MKIIYKDNEIIVCEKDQGTVSEDAAGGLPGKIRAELKDPELQVYTVHRLDKETGGLILYALTQEAASKLSKQITDDIFQKEYLTVVEGCPKEKQGILENLLFHDVKNNKTYAVNRKRKGVKEAKLEYHLLDSVQPTNEAKDSNTTKTLSLLKIILLTGRTHQIRAQFASRKMPVAGDRRYGSKIECSLSLWSYSLNFIHPATKKQLNFHSSPPQDYPWIEFHLS